METITTKEIYYAAMYNLMSRREHEEEINEDTKKRLGRENEICKHRMAKYDAQIKELHDAILELEKSGR